MIIVVCSLQILRYGKSMFHDMEKYGSLCDFFRMYESSPIGGGMERSQKLGTGKGAYACRRDEQRTKKKKTATCEHVTALLFLWRAREDSNPRPRA